MQAVRLARQIYGKFTVEFDGQYGPYFECNPINVFDSSVELDPISGVPAEWGTNQYPSPAFVDTRTFECGQGCLQPTAGDCHNERSRNNGTFGYGGAWQCWCDGTGRHNKTVGREVPPYTQSHDMGPASWVPQCRLGYYQYTQPFSRTPEQCVDGTPLGKTVSGWSFESVTAAACDACDKDERCKGWRTDNNRTATLLTGFVRGDAKGKCIGGVKGSDPYHQGSSWGAAGDLGGFWYSTPITGECAAGKPLGTDGCSWRVAAETYRNASCVDGLVDKAVEEWGAKCFATCSKPLNRTGDCYLNCYKNTLLGDAAYNVSAVPHAHLTQRWEGGFDEGGCAPITPARCEGAQCGDRLHEPVEQAAVAAA